VLYYFLLILALSLQLYKNYKSVMSEAFSIERRKLMRFLGARVILTNPAHKATGMIIKAKGK
jgi:cysteine synthase